VFVNCWFIDSKPHKTIDWHHHNTFGGAASIKNQGLKFKNFLGIGFLPLARNLPPILNPSGPFGKGLLVIKDQLPLNLVESIV
jgi:hypothetical protein